MIDTSTRKPADQAQNPIFEPHRIMPVGTAVRVRQCRHRGRSAAWCQRPRQALHDYVYVDVPAETGVRLGAGRAAPLLVTWRRSALGSPYSWHCCIEPKGVLARAQSSEAGSTIPVENHDKPAIGALPRGFWAGR